MRSSLFLAVAGAASAAVAASVPLSTSLPASAFPGFKTISLDEAREGKDLPNGFNLSDADSSNQATHVQTAAEAACSANPNIRYEWRQYSDSDKSAFINAIKCLINKPSSGNFPPAQNRYEDLARVHQMYMPNIHQNAKFLIWHRYFLFTFQMVLRNECGFDRAFPWWDETRDAGRFSQSGLFTDQYFGTLTTAQNGNPTCVTNGAFGGVTAHIGPGSSNTAHCISRAGDASLTSQCNSNFVNTCNSRTSYADMESCSEYGPHAYGHNGIGGVMADVAGSPSDPIFWMHHSFVDHSFRIWQNVDSSRLSNINGNDAQGNPLTLDTTLNVGGIFPTVKVRDVLNTLGGTTLGGRPFCYKYNY